MANYVEEIKELVIDGEDEEIVDKIKEAIDAGVSVGDIVNNGLIEAMNVIGPMMASGELFVPEVLMSAETMQVGLNYVKPLLQDGDLKSLGTVVIGTVEGDLHDIGKNLVAMMLESSGFTVINIGIDQSPQAFVDAIVENNAQIVGLSALLTTTMPAMRDTVALIKEKGLDVIGVGKISDIFAGEGITYATHTKSNEDGIKKTIELIKQPNHGLIFTNLVDFDMKWGHRNDPVSYGKGLEEFDSYLPQIIEAMNEDDLLIITADHGCDPTTPGTDHTREYVPLIAYSKMFNGARDLGTRKSFADIGQTICEIFDLPALKIGESFYKQMTK